MREKFEGEKVDVMWIDEATDIDETVFVLLSKDHIIRYTPSRFFIDGEARDITDQRALPAPDDD